MLEPRRLATASVARRMAEILGEEVGETVGYRIRFEKRVGPTTRIEVVIEGILTRMLQSDNALEGVGMVIFDEFHERNLHADVALALCREAQQILRDDLRILVMSATLNLPELGRLLQADIVESEGRQYPVEVKYGAPQEIMALPEITAQTIKEASEENEGDILVFLPGQAEILRTEEILRRSLPEFSIHPLFGQLPPAKQRQAIYPSKDGRRKVVLATSIAETSLTIEGITVVVDSGFGRTSRFDPRSGLSRLETITISKDSADQRAGRAGRLSPGTCYRLWSRADHDRMAKHRTAEILEADLAPLVLEMSQWGIEDIWDMTWLTPPPKGTVEQAYELLEELEALEERKITEHGKALNRLPCHPRIAHMLLRAQEDEALELATDLAAILEEKDPLPRNSGVDVNLRIEALRRARNNGGNPKFFNRIEKIAQSYRRLFGLNSPNNGPVDPNESGFLLAQAFPERIASAKPGNNAQFMLANGKMAFFSHRDELANEPWIAVANVDARDKMGKIFLASPLNPRDLAPLVKEREIIEWDTKRGGLLATQELRIGSIILKSTPLDDPDPEEIQEAICQAIEREGQHLLNFDKEVSQWQYRIESLRAWNPEQEWPDVSTEHLVKTNREWLSPYLDKVKKPEDLKKIDLRDVLQHSLDWEKQQLLDELAPERIVVPSGSNIAIEYQPNGAPPVLAVRLQEMFGLADTPCINQGKTSLLLHLLSPGFKPVQVTSDLRSFWDNTYHEVKKELKRRYPKHAWPEDPWTEEAVRGVKRKK